MDPIKRQTKKEFYAKLGFTKSTFQRRSKQIGFVIPRSFQSEEVYEEYYKRLKEYEADQIIKANEEKTEPRIDPADTEKEKRMNKNKDDPK